MIGKTISHYRIVEKIGAGGMGVVYRARDERLERDVALKALPAGVLTDERARKRFRQEALALSQLNHPNIATVHDFDTQEGVDFLVLEYIPGVTLNEKLAAGPLGEKELLRLGGQMMQGLAAAHEAGVTHRDLKPGNLRITPDGRLKILDFGLAKLLRPDSEMAATESLTEAHAVAGTLPYMAPEQLRGQPVDRRSDIYAAGAVLYEMATGHRAFPQEQGPMLIDAILHHAPQPPTAWNRQVPPVLENMILKALDRDPERRYQSAKELGVDFDRLATPSAVAAGPARAHGRRWMLTAAALLILMVAVGSYLLRELLVFPKEDSPRRMVLAVLPFHLLSAPEEIRFLRVGLPDSIITRLAGVGQVLLRPTSAILRYENQTVDPKEAGRALASDYVLTGIVHHAGERLRVSVQLVRTNDGAPIWGKQYDLARADLLSLQDGIAEQVVEALKIQMTAAERERFYRRFTDNRAAYEAYLRGRANLLRSSEEGARAAVESFEGALRIDSKYGLARAGLAMACAQMRLRFAPEAETKGWGDRAEAEARRLLEMEPNLAEAHEAAASVYRSVEFDWERTIEESRRALELNPNLDQPHYYLAAAFSHLGLLELPEREIRAALEINPESRADAVRSRGIAALWSGQFDEAVVAFEEARRLSRSRAFDWVLGQAYYYQGERTRAEETLTFIYHGPPGRRSQAILASFLAARGATERAQEVLSSVLASGYMDHHVAYDLGQAYVQLGNPVQARHWLKQAAETGLPCYPWMERDPLLNPLRNDPEFRRFLAESRRSWESLKARYGSQ